MGVTPQTTTLKDEKRVDSNLPYSFVLVGGLEQVPLELPTPWVSGPPVLTTLVSDNAKILILFDSPTIIDYVYSMKTLLIILGVILVATPFIFILIESVVERLPKDHRLVLWWREHIANHTDDDLF